MQLMDLLSSILNPNPGQNRLVAPNSGGPNYLAQTGLGPEQLARFHQMSGMGGQPAPPQGVAPQQAGSRPAAATSSVAPQQAQGGGILSRLLGGSGNDANPVLNETAQWLQQQGYDPGTAHALAGNRDAMQKILLSQVGGNKPIEINGRLVDPNTYEVIADFSDKAGGDKPPTSYQEYQLAKQDGFKGSYTDWQTKSIREQDPGFSREKDLRQEYENNPVVKNYQIVRDNYERIRTGAQSSSGSGDLAIVFGYMKMLDPTSVVREGEQASAMNAGGVPANVRNLYNRVIDGDKLDESVRSQFVTSAAGIYGESAKNLADFNTRYGGIAQNWELDPARIVQQPEQYEPVAPPAEPGMPLPPAAQAAPAAPLPGPRAAFDAAAAGQPPAAPVVRDWRELMAPGRR